MAINLIDKGTEYIIDEFYRKASILETFGEEMTPEDFYEEAFYDLDLVVPTICLSLPRRAMTEVQSLYDAIDFCKGRNDVLLGSCTSYSENYISKNLVHEVYAFVIDLDNVTSRTLAESFTEDGSWVDADGNILPLPTAIVNSGGGLHLWYMFDDVLPCYNRNKWNLKRIYDALCEQQSNRTGVPLERHWYGQQYRMVGGGNKYPGLVNTAYKVGEKWDVDELAKECGLPGVHIWRLGEPFSAGKVQKKKEYHPFTSNKGFYTAIIKGCKEKTKEGKRYTSLCAITAVAFKCGIPEDTLKEDLSALIKHYNKNCKNPVEQSEIDKAVAMYNSKARTISRKTLEDWIGWKFEPKIKRNKPEDRHPRKKTEAMRSSGELTNIEVYASKKRDEMYPGGSWRGPGNVKASKKQIIDEWRKKNPNGRRIDCERETGISHKTVLKWWD